MRTSYEFQLHDWLLQNANINSLAKSISPNMTLEIIGSEKQLAPDSRCDILAKTKDGQLVIIELKRSVPDASHVKQIQRYVRHAKPAFVIWVCSSFFKDDVELSLEIEGASVYCVQYGVRNGNDIARDNAPWFKLRTLDNAEERHIYWERRAKEDRVKRQREGIRRSYDLLIKILNSDALRYQIEVLIPASEKAYQKWLECYHDDKVADCEDLITIHSGLEEAHYPLLEIISDYNKSVQDSQGNFDTLFEFDPYGEGYQLGGYVHPLFGRGSDERLDEQLMWHRNRLIGYGFQLEYPLTTFADVFAKYLPK